MARLIDWIMDAGEIVNYPGDKIPVLLETLPHCHKIICDEAAEYYHFKNFGENPKIGDFVDVDISTLHCVRPPFENLWMEFRINQSNIFTGAYVRFLTADESTFNCDTVWFTIFAGTKGRVRLYGSEWMQIDKNGRPYRFKQESHNPLKPDAESASLTFAFCLSLINAHAPLEDSPPYDAPLQKARQRRGKLPFFEYRILSLVSKQARAKAGLPGQSAGGKNRLHIVRGHFREYKADKPLLGRAVGTFWFTQHLAGSKDAGTIRKDYQLKCPKRTESEKYQE